MRSLAATAVLVLGAQDVRARPGAEDYRVIFGERYVQAERYLADNPWIARDLGLPPEETAIALAVVFPEIVRFSYLEDRIQVRTLKVLYVQYGRKYANFSVGHFQMKPSFVEHLESDWNRLTDAGEKAAAGVPAFALADEPGPRSARIQRLDDMRWQVAYLRMFMAVMKKRYAAVAFADAEDRLRFYATAYNAGYASGEARLRRKMAEKSFHLELFSPKRSYGYADVALSYFRRPSSQ